ncbi:hypothetical protein AKJ16_DCAP25853 [Drosera capensis]
MDRFPSPHSPHSHPQTETTQNRQILASADPPLSHHGRALVPFINQNTSAHFHHDAQTSQGKAWYTMFSRLWCTQTILQQRSRRACMIFPMSTKIVINDALFCPRSRRNLLSIRDIRSNGFHVRIPHPQEKAVVNLKIVVENGNVNPKFMDWNVNP